MTGQCYPRVNTLCTHCCKLVPFSDITRCTNLNSSHSSEYAKRKKRSMWEACTSTEREYGRKLWWFSKRRAHTRDKHIAAPTVLSQHWQSAFCWQTKRLLLHKTPQSACYAPPAQSLFSALVAASNYKTQYWQEHLIRLFVRSYL